MPLATAFAAGLTGVEGFVVEVEADLAQGLPSFTLVGLPDAMLHEARDRIRAAVVNSGGRWPSRRITVGLSPASLRKRGTSFDVAIAAAVLAAAGDVPVDGLAGTVLLGELALDGRVRGAPGTLPAVIAAAAAGIPRVVVPTANAREARLVPGVDVTAVSSLRGLLAHLRGEPPPPEDEVAEPEHEPSAPPVAPPDLRDVVGQYEARCALEVAAAGGHHLLLLGPPGAGKTMLVERMPGLLPALDLQSSLEVTAVHSVAGALRSHEPLITRPPYSAPHHTASVAAIVGGGSGLARPGAASLAHRGILFLDEAPEFARRCLDGLRQPLESGEVILARAGGTVRYPARFTLALAANPCPCGLPEEQGCTCGSHARRRYLGRLSGPLLDRIDVTVQVARPGLSQLLAERRFVEESASVATRVAAARRLAAEVFAAQTWQLPSEIPGRALRDGFAPAPGAVRVLEVSSARGGLSARGVDRVLRLAWTVALLEGRTKPQAEDVGVALSLREGAPG